MTDYSKATPFANFSRLKTLNLPNQAKSCSLCEYLCGWFFSQPKMMLGQPTWGHCRIFLVFPSVPRSHWNRVTINAANYPVGTFLRWHLAPSWRTE